MAKSSEESPSRRTFMLVVIGLISTVIGVALTVPILGDVLNPLFKKRDIVWTKLGKVSDFEKLKPLAPKFTPVYFRVKEGWSVNTLPRQVVLVKDVSGNFNFFSNQCTHLGCPLHWDSLRQEFLCPCHGGMFNVLGKVTGGPPPRPLYRWVHKIENGTVFVQNKYVYNPNERGI
ncbi:ubiquinol-cytochrome c reductase iron-sulfur subunit [Candidatus Acidulodesulfobacterium sp. H_13]|uniref:ubiquinol-cytochrome c reductase iron-sulfur subunit n=1 Tax=Candidatus Acidulodesulfobacterium sp. H_13 TaxID=3395470 RepID=UPI003AF45326